MSDPQSSEKIRDEAERAVVSRAHEEVCGCDLRNRAWNPNTGRCERCGGLTVCRSTTEGVDAIINGDRPPQRDFELRGPSPLARALPLMMAMAAIPPVRLRDDSRPSHGWGQFGHKGRHACHICGKLCQGDNALRQHMKDKHKQ